MKKISLLLSGVLLLTGCAPTLPLDTFTLNQQKLQDRQIESRRYDNTKIVDLISASASTLQDLGFNLENSETQLGVLTANKQRDATNAGEMIGAFAAALFGVRVGVSVSQHIRVSIVVKPVLDTSKNQTIETSNTVRVTFQRVVYKSDNSVVTETIKDPELFKQFFERLSKSVFIEGQKV